MTPEVLLEATLVRTRPPDESVRAGAAHAFDAKTKPRGSLGRIGDTTAASGVRSAVERREPTAGDPLGTLAALGGEMATFGEAGVTGTGA